MASVKRKRIDGDSHADDEHLVTAQRALMWSSPPDSDVVCREEYQSKLTTFVESNLQPCAEPHDRILLLCGQPGIGKTLVTDRVVSNLRHEQTKKRFTIHSLNAVNFACNPYAVLTTLLDDVRAKDVSSSVEAPIRKLEPNKKETAKAFNDAKSDFVKLLTNTNGKTRVLIIDELDYLVDTHNNVLPFLFSVTQLKHSRLVILGISNCTGMTPKVCHYLFMSILKDSADTHTNYAQEMVFPTYRAPQIIAIIKHRVTFALDSAAAASLPKRRLECKTGSTTSSSSSSSSSSNHERKSSPSSSGTTITAPCNCPFFTDDALTLLAQTIAQNSGDVRQALVVASRALKLASLNDSDTTWTEKRQVSLLVMRSTLAKNCESSLVTTVRHLPPWQRFFLCIASVVLKPFGSVDVEFMYNAYGVLSNRLALPRVEYSVSQDFVEALVTSQLLAKSPTKARSTKKLHQSDDGSRPEMLTHRSKKITEEKKHQRKVLTLLKKAEAKEAKEARQQARADAKQIDGGTKWRITTSTSTPTKNNKGRKDMLSMLISREDIVNACRDDDHVSLRIMSEGDRLLDCATKV